MVQPFRTFCKLIQNTIFLESEMHYHFVCYADYNKLMFDGCFHAAVKTYCYHDNKLIKVSTIIIWTVSNVGNHSIIRLPEV